MDRARVDVRCADIDAFLHLEAFLCQAEYKPPSSSSSSSVAWYYNAAALTSSSADAAASSAPPPPPTPSSPTPSSPPARGHFRRQSAGVDNPRQLVDVVVGTHDRLGAELVTCLLPTENRIIVDCAAILHSSILENSGVQPSDWLVRVGTAELNLVGLFEVDATTQRVLKTQPAAKLAVALEAIDKLGQTSTKTRSAYEEQAERALTEHFGEGADDVLQRRVDVYVLINLLNSVMLRRIAWICSNAPRPLSLRFTRAAAGDYSKGVVSEIVLEDDDDGAATSAAKKKQALLARTRSEPMVMARLGGSQTVTVEIAAAGKLGVTLGVDPVTGAVIVVSIAQGGLVAQGVQAECSGSSRHFLDRRRKVKAGAVLRAIDGVVIESFEEIDVDGDCFISQAEARAMMVRLRGKEEVPLEESSALWARCGADEGVTRRAFRGVMADWILVETQRLLATASRPYSIEFACPDREEGL